jgi:hypothetical protein
MKAKHHPNYIPPHNTGKVKIGLHYVPPQRDYNTPESLRIQQVLLHKTPPKPRPRRRIETTCLIGLVLVVLALVS